jgi:UDP-N-acetylglucosamine--N-acetylmuramyl-(pentapeptide) pyrophosphoryl-undecaprenol N-acetylglucosamine transferase
MNNNFIIIATGGTGGHIFPAEAVKKALTQKGYKVLMLVDEKYKNFIQIGQNIIELPSSPITGGIFNKIVKIYKIILSICLSIKILYKYKPKLILGFGGYPSFPPCIAAYLLKIPYILHEQNAILGKTNEFMLKKALFLATSFKDTEKIPLNLNHKIKYTGNPIRDEFKNITISNNDLNKLKILVIGGSQGASVFAKIIPEAIKTLPDDLKNKVSIIQQSRKEEIEAIKKQYVEVGIKHEVSHFFNNINTKLSESNLVIARAGAGTIAEIQEIGIFAILVPLPNSARNHQYINALKYTKEKSAIIMEQNKDFTAENLREKITFLLNNSNNIIVKRKPPSKATENIVRLITSLDF